MSNRLNIIRTIKKHEPHVPAMNLKSTYLLVVYFNKTFIKLIIVNHKNVSKHIL